MLSIFPILVYANALPDESREEKKFDLDQNSAVIAYIYLWILQDTDQINFSSLN